MTSILIVEDERNLSNLIRRNLEEEGHCVSQVFDGPSAVEAVAAQEPDLVILDVMLPGMDGLQVCRSLRQGSIVPVLMLTARAEEIDRVLGLEVGADDYLTKPFSMRELKARVRAILRRVEMMQAANEPPRDEVVAVAGLRLNPANYEVILGEQPLELTPKEFALLYLLVRHPGRVFSRAYLLDEIWGYSAEAYDRTVDTHIYRLRQKLGAESEIAQRIAAVRGIGYKFERV
jgi:two-component system alkaline phosphatase synthesis response regulator PhoP